MQEQITKNRLLVLGSPKTAVMADPVARQEGLTVEAVTPMTIEDELAKGDVLGVIIDEDPRALMALRKGEYGDSIDTRYIPAMLHSVEAAGTRMDRFRIRISGNTLKSFDYFPEEQGSLLGNSSRTPVTPEDIRGFIGFARNLHEQGIEDVARSERIALSQIIRDDSSIIAP